MPKKSAASPKFMQLHKHRLKDRKLWQEYLEQISNVDLPVTFHGGDSSQAFLVNEDLDEEARGAFEPVIRIIDAIKNGALLIRPLADDDTENIESVLTDNRGPPKPDQSVGYVEDFSERLAELLTKFIKPRKTA